MAGARPPPAAGIVLAAGTSSRMGRNKLLLEIGGLPLVRRVVAAALGAGLEPVVAVLGHDAEATGRALAGLGCRLVENRGYERGMTSSLRTGVAALPPQTPAAIMILGDMPGVDEAMLAALAAEHARAAGEDPDGEPPPLVASRYGEVYAPPTLFDRRLFPELLTLPDDRNPRWLARRHRDRAREIAWPAAALRDLDRPEDLAAEPDADPAAPGARRPEDDAGGA